MTSDQATVYGLYLTVVLVLVGLLRAAPKLYKKWRTLDRMLERTERVITQADAVLQVAAMAAPLALVVHELSANGGKSIKDTVTRLDKSVGDLVIAQAEFRAELLAHRLVDHGIPEQRTPGDDE